MSRMYSVAFSAVSKSAGGMDFFAIFVGSIPLRIREFGIISYDASADNVNLDLISLRKSGAITPGSGGGTPTPVALKSTDPAASFTAHIVDTTQTSSTVTDELLAYGVDLDKGLIYSPSVDLCPVLNSGEAWILSSGASSGADHLDAFVLIEELS